MRGLVVFTERECIPAVGATGESELVASGAMDELVGFVQEELAARADPGRAVAMAAYMKTDMPFYGVQKKGRTEVFRAMRSRFPVDNVDEYREVVAALWERPHREEKYLAVAVAKNYTQFLTVENFDLYHRLIVEGAWWDFVDEVAINCVGIAYLNDRAHIEPIIEEWVDDESMWLRRSSLISPIKHKSRTNHQMLFDHCLRRADEKEFFIRKAIGWTLREYAKTEPERVRKFLLCHRDRWSGLTFREAGKHLDV